MTLLRAAPLGLVALLAACQDPLPAATNDASTNTDAGPVDNDASTDTDGAVTPPDGGENLGAERLSYTPAGCMHTVSTEMGTRLNFRDDTTTFGSAPAPANVHVSWAADPSSTIAFLWRTDEGTRATVVQYGTSMTALDQTVTGHVSSGGTSTGEVTMHEVHVCGLTPDTTYYYRVGGEGHWSDVQSFKTAPAPGRADYDVNFVVSGDSRDNFTTWRQVQEATVMGPAMSQPDFQIFSGDAVLLGTQQSAWQQWFDGARASHRLMPMVMAHGNHDALAINYLMQFAQPQTSDPQQSELYFSFDYGPIHFVFLNDTPFRGDYTGNVGGTQLTWLRADLTRANMNRSRVPFVVAVHHKPCFGSSRHSSSEDTLFLRRTWAPVFDQLGVDLVFNGHEHDFELSKQLDGNGNEVSGRRGTYYMVAAGAGAQLYERTMNMPYSAYYESVVNYVRVHATNASLTVTPYRLDGTVIDQGRLTLTPRM